MSSDMIISEAIEYVNKLFAGNSDGHGTKRSSVRNGRTDMQNY